ncbi:MAG TPA: SDR family oxidoreductase [Thermoanaerobaculia bacterium]|nr:SDR family oxidoreductase [Thermoanaerobaculia bacterium]
MTDSVVVTGGGGALGAAVVARSLAEGWRVIAVDAVERRLERVRAAHPGGAVETARVDLADSGSVDDFFTRDLGATPRVAHLVGGFACGPLAELDDETWRSQIEVNLDTTFRLFRACARAFAKAGAGSLVAVSSPHALVTPANVAAYAAAKAGVLRLVQGLAAELGRAGRVNAVLPQTMDTPANRTAMPDVDPAQWIRTEDVAEVIVFLLSERARGVSGAFVEVGHAGG